MQVTRSVSWRTGRYHYPLTHTLTPSHPHTLTPSHPLTPPQVLPELMVSVVAVIASMNLDTINRVVSVVVERGGGGGGGAPTAVRIAQNEVHCVHVYGNNDR